MIVSGAPGSGKSTLARRLGGELRLPVLSKDGIKEVLYDTVGAPNRAASQRLGAASFALLSHAAAALLGANVSIILDANYQRGFGEAELRSLLPRARTVLLHCGGDAAVMLCRYRERAERGERHAGHDDIGALPRLRRQLRDDTYAPLDLAVPVLLVDTTTATAYAPEFDAIVRFVHGCARRA